MPSIHSPLLWNSGPSLLGCEQLLKFSRHRLCGIIYLPMVCPACYGDEEIKARPSVVLGRQSPASCQQETSRGYGQLTKMIRESYEGAVDESEPTSERGMSVGDLSGDESSDEGAPRPKRVPLKMAESPSSTKSSNSGDSNGSESEDEMDSPPSVKKRSSDLPSKPKAPKRRKN
mmetsp:Transcript_11509/g.24948  ORF Transcript_11509/g.24948 Transcript_11509/m.24948 type:complete len:174 (-) Transcript_11509:85-606(-)